MTPRPIYRWKTFWLGLLVTCFLAWAAWDSTAFRSYASLRQFQVENAGGGISIRRTSPPYTSAIVGKFQSGRSDMKTFAGMFPNTTPTLFVAPFFLRGENKTIERHDTDKFNLDSLSYYGFLRAFMPYEPKEDWRAFIPYWLLLSAFVVPWLAFLVYRGRKQVFLDR